MSETAVSPLETLESVKRLRRDIRTAISTLSLSEARFLVDAYYSIQDYRKAAREQVRSLSKSNEPHEVLSWLFNQQEVLESEVKKALDKWTDTNPVSQWAKSIVGIGPIIAAGLLAHIDIKKAPTAGHIWSFAGIHPAEWDDGQMHGSRQWLPKTKRPWNAKLKVILFHAGESFVKVQSHKDDFYGKLYRVRKDQEIANNDLGKFVKQALDKAERVGKATDAYPWYAGMYPAGTSHAIQALDTEARAKYLKTAKLEAGKGGTPMLPPAHIHARARRYVMRMFSSHYQWIAYRYEFGIDPPMPYVITHMGHVDLMRPPNFPW